MEDLHLRQPALRQPSDLRPDRAVVLTAAAERVPPEPDKIAAESDRSRAVGGHHVLGEGAPHDLGQPTARFGDRLMPAPWEFELDLLELGLHPLAPGLAALSGFPGRNFPLRLFAQDVGEAREVAGKFGVSGLPRPRSARLAAAKRPNSMSCPGAANPLARSRSSPSHFGLG